MAIEFNHFSSQSFEQLVQAICVEVLGHGLVVFGSGPDGGREATFEGQVPFPTYVDRWNGYIVVHAKCRQVLRNNVEDAKWLCQQLTRDLDKFLDKGRVLKKPEFYIIASNVTLSSVDKKGGKSEG